MLKVRLDVLRVNRLIIRTTDEKLQITTDDASRSRLSLDDRVIRC